MSESSTQDTEEVKIPIPVFPSSDSSDDDDWVFYADLSFPAEGVLRLCSQQEGFLRFNYFILWPKSQRNPGSRS